MAKIPLPERGQPIDVSYIYQITNAVNQLSDRVSTTGFNYTTIDTPSSGKQDIKTSEARVIGGSVVVSTNSSQGADTTKSFTYSYGGNFKYTPVATATVVNTGLTPAGDGATVVLTSVDANGLAGLVRFDKAGNVSVTVNLIIVGIPN
jgi:hypothetical protein